MTNVLVIMADEHQAKALGCAGHDVVQTPNLDALASQGTRFENCWTPSPICVPARASFATGTWVHENGSWDSAQAYCGDPRGWAHSVRDAGHQAVSFGKLHHRSAADDDGFTDRVSPMFIVGGIGWVQGLLRRDPLAYDEAAELAEEVGSGHTTYTRYDERVTERAEDWLAARTPAEAPWAAFVSLVAPHYPLSAPDEFTEMYTLDDIAPPTIGCLEISHPAVAAVASFFDYGAYFDDALTLEGRRAYFALCSWVDANVGRLLAALERSGCGDDTVVIFTSDHGEMLGERGLWCKSFMYQDSLRIPMIVAGPGVPAGAVNSTNVNLVDVGRTVTEVMGTDPVGGGESLLATAAKSDPDRLAFSEYHDGGSITGSFAVQHGPWKYVEHVDYPSELYNLDDDPLELADLGEDDRCKSERKACADALRSICDPVAMNLAAFASQEWLIAELGGREAVASAFRFNATPAPVN